MSQLWGDDIQALPYLKDYRTGQVTTHGHDRPIGTMVPTWKPFADRMHRDFIAIPPGGSWSFDEIPGPAKIVNIWCTASPPMDFNLIEKPLDLEAISRNFPAIWHLLRYDRFPQLLQGVNIEIRFDDDEVPSVSAPLGDFFGVGFGEYKHYTSRYLAMTAGGYICQFHMPFRKRARVTLVNTNPALWVPAFYGAVTYIQYKNAFALSGQGTFHAHYNRQAPTQPGEPYLIFDSASMGAPGKPGHYVGVVLNTEGATPQSNFHFLEGNTKFYVDGEESPSLEYTGLEDYYQGAWYYMKTPYRLRTEFAAPYHGLTVKSLTGLGMLGTMLLGSTKRMRLSQYRFHPEGIPFKKSLRVTVHHGEFDEVESNFSSVVYWYQKR